MKQNKASTAWEPTSPASMLTFFRERSTTSRVTSSSSMTASTRQPLTRMSTASTSETASSVSSLSTLQSLIDTNELDLEPPTKGNGDISECDISEYMFSESTKGAELFSP